MGIIHSMDPSTCTVVVDIGLDNPIAVWVPVAAGDVAQRLQKGDWIQGDSSIGEVWFNQSGAKFLQPGKREFNYTAHNRPSNSPLGL